LRELNVVNFFGTGVLSRDEDCFFCGEGIYPRWTAKQSRD
jgi:hypothetical protein